MVKKKKGIESKGKAVGNYFQVSDVASCYSFWQSQTWIYTEQTLINILSLCFISY